MRALRYLVPRDVKDSLDASAIFQWFVTLLMVAIGVMLVVKGINGIKNQRLSGKYGRVFEGSTAQVLGVIYIALGILMAVVALGVKLATSFAS